MQKIGKPSDQSDTSEQDFNPLTAQEAAAWRAQHRELSPWWGLPVQLAAGSVVSLLVAWCWGATAAWSAAYGALSVVVPYAVFARGVLKPRQAGDAAAAVASFFVWEVAKIGLTLAMLMLANKLVVPLSWPALLGGLVVTMKTSWVVLALGPKRRLGK
jgi:ATP synthase protein I